MGDDKDAEAEAGPEGYGTLSPANSKHKQDFCIEIEIAAGLLASALCPVCLGDCSAKSP